MICATAWRIALFLADVGGQLPDPVAELRALAADDLGLAAVLDGVRGRSGSGVRQAMSTSPLSTAVLSGAGVAEVLDEDLLALRGSWCPE